MLTLRGTELQFLQGVVPSFLFNHQIACPEISMSWQKLVLLNYTPMCQTDAPCGLVHPLACSEASSEQTHGLRGGPTKLNTFITNGKVREYF